MTSLAVYAVYVTPTDLAGWIDAAPGWLVIAIAALSLAALFENTVRGKRLVDAAIRRIEKSR